MGVPHFWKLPFFDMLCMCLKHQWQFATLLCWEWFGEPLFDFCFAIRAVYQEHLVFNNDSYWFHQRSLLPFAGFSFPFLDAYIVLPRISFIFSWLEERVIIDPRRINQALPWFPIGFPFNQSSHGYTSWKVQSTSKVCRRPSQIWPMRQGSKVSKVLRPSVCTNKDGW